jgi:polyphosphate kinase 2 (PPK2 family)
MAGTLNSPRATALRQLAVVAVFEGNDAAGKGGAIRRVTQALDARQYSRLRSRRPPRRSARSPTCGVSGATSRAAAASRSSTARGTAGAGRARRRLLREADWMRAYREINEFERSSRATASVVVKFWLAISKEEQLRRFREREKDAVQALQDHRRGLAQPQEVGRLRSAVCDMVDRTSTTPRPGRWSRPTTSITRGSRY